MKLFELFGVIGLKDEGVGPGLDRIDRKAIKAAAALATINAALFALLATSAKAGAALKEFQIRTGLSTDNLQAWQQQAAASNVTAEELTDQIKNLQDQRTAFQMNDPQAMGAWTMLGIDPRQDPFSVLAKLRERLSSFKDVGLARRMATNAGISEGMFQMLRQDPAGVNQNLILNQRQIDSLFRIKTAWNSFVLAVSSAKTQLGAALAPTMELVIQKLTKLASWLAKVTQWLSTSSTGAKIARYILGALAAVIVVLGLAVGALASALTLASAATALFNVVAAPEIALVIAAAAAIGVMVAALIGMVLVYEDLYTASQGGKSFFSWSKDSINQMLLMISALEKLAIAFTKVMDLAERFSKFTDSNVGLNLLVPGAGILPDIAKWMAPLSKSASSGPVTVNQDVDIHVNGSKDPKATGQEVGGVLKEQVNSAYRQGASANW